MHTPFLAYEEGKILLLEISPKEKIWVKMLLPPWLSCKIFPPISTVTIHWELWGRNLKAIPHSYPATKIRKCLLAISSYEHLLFCLKTFSVLANEVQDSLHLDLISQLNFGYLNTYDFFQQNLLLSINIFP